MSIGLPPSTVDNQSLLEQLIKEGLNFSGARNIDIAQVRNLLQVLFTACILDPTRRSHSLSQSDIQQTEYTLAILAKQVNTHPELLLSLPPPDQAQIPFFKWILPRLIGSASKLEDSHSGISERLVASAVSLLSSLAREVEVERVEYTNPATGPHRLAGVMREILTFCTESVDGQISSLYETELSGPSAILLSLDIILQIHHPFVNNISASACLLVSKARKLSKGREALYTLVVASALGHKLRNGLTQACTTVCGFEPSTDDRRVQASERFYKVLQLSDDVVRCALWWSLHDQINIIRLPASFDSIRHLLTPILPGLQAETIRKLIPDSVFQRWSKEKTILDDAKIEGLRQLLQELESTPSERSRKRKRNEERDAFTTLAERLPDVKPKEETVESLAEFFKSCDKALALDFARVFPRFICALVACRDHSQPVLTVPEAAFPLWLVVADRVEDESATMRSLAMIIDHTSKKDVALHVQMHKSVLAKVWKASQSSTRQIRVIAGRIVSLITEAQHSHPSAKISQINRNRYLNVLEMRLTEAVPIRETTILTLGDIGKHTDDPKILQLLLLQLGSSSSPLRSLAYTELLNVAKHRGKTPYTLLSAHLKPISILVAQNLARSPDMVTETMQFIHYTRKDFLKMTLHFTLPALVLSQNSEALQLIASVVQENLGMLLIDNSQWVLSEVFLNPSTSDSNLRFLIELIRVLVGDIEISTKSLMTTCIVPLLVSLVVELGDNDTIVRERANRALQRAQKEQTGDPYESDLGAFLKPSMLGVINNMNELLHDQLGKKTVEVKQKIVRSLGSLIELVGDTMSSFSPQIMANLQSTLGIKELRRETLKSWDTFIRTLKFADVGPFVGPTTAAMISNWSILDFEEKRIAIDIINYIAENKQQLASFVDEVVGLDNIPELATAASRLTAERRRQPFKVQLENLIKRAKSANVAVATMTMKEIKVLLQSSDIANLSQGDTFDPILASIVQTLLAAAARDGDCQPLRDLAYDCLGTIGALDPDRIAIVPEDRSMTLMSNFANHEESIEFALHLIKDLLVGAFKATNDTRFQTRLAFTIQELLRFCGFNHRLLQPSSSIAVKTRTQWLSLGKDLLETLSPLLGGQFKFPDVVKTQHQKPLYTHAPTYREWIQMWTTSLIYDVETLVASDRAIADSQHIFRVFLGIVRGGQDVTIAHHLLPHLVLHVLLSGAKASREDIRNEINAVLRDQVSSIGPSDKRTLSSQVIFDLMDHLSKWLRLQRMIKYDRHDRAHLHIRVVDGVLAGIEVELMANAALKSKAYARSLRSFEQRIVQLRKEKREDSELQEYFERLHQIYADLDEPDGMEGVSAFVISPSLEHQIREHESTGRWTSAQSCWEVRLQQSPEDVLLHVGLLRCLRNLGHYDTFRTHIRGVLSRRPAWSTILAPFEAEAAWMDGDWATVAQVEGAPPIASVLLAMHNHQDLEPVLTAARRIIGTSITTKQYSRVYEPILQLHMMREVEMINQASKSSLDATNARAIDLHARSRVISALENRFNTTSPSFRVREELLSVRRTAFNMSPTLKSEIGNSWIQSSKIARKAGYEQTAYSATLQAKEVDAPFAFLQQTKLLRAHGGALKALTDLENTVRPLLRIAENAGTGGIAHATETSQFGEAEKEFATHRNLAKAVLLEARWADESGRFEANVVIERYKKAIKLAPSLESPYYRLGHYYDSMPYSTPDMAAAYHRETIHNYIQALRHGVKYIFQTMPRMLTLWLDLGETAPRTTKVDTNWPTDPISQQLERITTMVDRARKDLPAYQFLTAFPQIVSRIVHPHKLIGAVISKIILRCIVEYPLQALWPIVGVMQSNRIERKKTCDTVLQRAKTGTDPRIAAMIRDANRLSTLLLRLSNDTSATDIKDKPLSARKDYSYVTQAFPSRMMIPLQDALTCTLPSSAATVNSHKPFNDQPVEMLNIDDRIDIMPSLQKPKKLRFLGTDGKTYPFLCKPHDDLRKDARLMDFNSMINKLLKSATESRRRQLYIRTYAVMPLNEECGLLEWVNNTQALKSILEKGYARYNKKIYTTELYNTIAQAGKQSNAHQVKAFKEQVLPMYAPTVFHEWFMTTWPEPSAWLASRMAYARTLAVMSMIGYVLGLGDRHGENILFDAGTGDTVHVDLNCLFDKGKTFDVPERVPFRLTANMVDAMGVTGVEGVFRKAAEITLDLLRIHSDSLMSVLEAFVHDPLVEWTKPGRSKEKDVRISADRNLGPIKKKLRGIMDEGAVISVPNQVEALIKSATSPAHLGLMYVGWAAWL